MRPGGGNELRLENKYLYCIIVGDKPALETGITGGAVSFVNFLASEAAPLFIYKENEMKIVKYVFAGLFVFATLFALLYSLDSYSSEAFAGLGGVILSLAFKYFPWLSKDYDQLSVDQKRFVMGGLIFLAVVGVFALSCVGELNGFVCTISGGVNALIVFIMAVGANQLTYQGADYVQRKMS